MNKIEFSRKSFLGLFSLIVMNLFPFIILNSKYKQYYNIFIEVFIIFAIAFINGLIFGEKIKESILLFGALIELLIILYVSISFVFNPWGNASHIPITLGNLYTLIFAITFFSAFGFIFVLIGGLFMYQSAVIGIAVKQRNQPPISQNKLTHFS